MVKNDYLGKNINDTLNKSIIIQEDCIETLALNFVDKCINMIKYRIFSNKKIAKEINDLFPQLCISIKKRKLANCEGFALHRSYTDLQRFITRYDLPLPLENKIQYDDNGDLAETLDTISHELTHVLNSNSNSINNHSITSFLANKHGVNVKDLISFWLPFEKLARNIMRDII